MTKSNLVLDLVLMVVLAGADIYKLTTLQEPTVATIIAYGIMLVLFGAIIGLEVGVLIKSRNN